MGGGGGWPEGCIDPPPAPEVESRVTHAALSSVRHRFHVHSLQVAVGDSFLRQVIEALSCRFAHLVTLRKVAATPVRKYPKKGPIPPGPMKEHYSQCQGNQPYFQLPPLSVPKENCNDDALVLRFGHDMIVYFLWRAASTLEAVRWFGINIPDISVVVSQPRIWTGHGGHPRFDLAQLRRWGYNGTLVYIPRSEARGTYERCLTISVLRLRDDVRADGGHVCVPSTPDDSVRLLLGMIANPTVLGTGCDLPPEDYAADGGEYIPLSTRGRIMASADKATIVADGFVFELAESERERFFKEWKGDQMKNKTLHDVDDDLEASYNRTYRAGIGP